MPEAVSEAGFNFLSLLEEMIAEQLQKDSVPLSKLLPSLFQRLSTTYREGKGSHALFQDSQLLLIYLASRAPATFAVMQAAIAELLRAAPDFSPKSVADIGAGMGVASFAALSLFPALKKATLVEIAPKAVEMAQLLTQKWMQKGLPPSFSLSVQLEDLKQMTAVSSDLTLFSYCLGELSAQAAAETVKKSWPETHDFLIITEPGTPRGFETLLACRRQLIELGAYLVAPCPHSCTCPLSQIEGRWCHFRQRIERSNWQKVMKDASLPWEDEKYCYLIASKKPIKANERDIDPIHADQARLLKEPDKHRGHLYLDLCHPNGQLEKVLLSKKQAAYKQGKKADWGDLFPLTDL